MSIGERISQARRAAGWSQGKLGAAVGQVQTTISSWERGRTEPTREDVQRVAVALGIDLGELEVGVQDREARKLVPLVGYVGAGAEAHFYEAADLGEVEAPDGSNEHTVAVEIRGTSLGSIFESWLVFYDEVRTPVTPDLIGRLCVVGLPNGKVLVKMIRKARTPGLYHLESNTEPTLADQEVDWAARVRSMTPR